MHAMRKVSGSMALLALVACSDSAGKTAKPAAGIDGGGAADAAAPFDSGVELRVPVPASGRVYVTLAPPALVAASAAWDIAFEGFDVHTNSGPSGPGLGAAFGPLDAVTFLGDAAPTVPFLTPDKPGGAFLDWYAYEGSTHALYSRFHVYGVQDGTRLWKVQVLGYYGQRDGAAVAGLYKIRYAELTGGTTLPTQEVDVDGTAGGTAAPATTPSECLDLGTGARTMLDPEAARQSSAWHLCFRRASISVNGEIGGPRQVGAIDLQAAAVAAETLTEVQTRTAAQELAPFDAAKAAAFDGRVFRGDRVVSVFGDAWIDRKQTPIAPANAVWLVTNADGAHKTRIGFQSFENPTTTSPGTVVMRIKPTKD